MHTTGARFDHGFHEFKGIQDPTKARFRISHNRYKVIDIVFPGRMLDFVGTFERVIDSANHRGYRIDRVKRLIRIHRVGDVGVGSHLPARQVNGFSSRLDLLYRLPARQRTQRWQKIIRIQSTPKFFGSQSGKAVLNMNGATQAQNIGR